MPHPAAPRVALKTNGKILLLDPADISAAEAQGNYVLIHRNGSSHLLRERISVVAEKLQAFGLLRIHRSVLVNAAHVEAVRPTTSGEYLLRMRGGKEYTVSRTYKSNLQHLATIWIGTDGFPEGDSLQEETLI
jgi:DNA-binding LytR/AlgR family response regulator